MGRQLLAFMPRAAGAVGVEELRTAGNVENLKLKTRLCSFKNYLNLFICTCLISLHVALSCYGLVEPLWPELTCKKSLNE